MSELEREPVVDEVLVSEDELDLSIIEGGERGLTVPVVYREILPDGSEEGDFVAREIKRFLVRRQLSTPMMTTFLRLETRINDALSMEDAAADELLAKCLDEAHRRIVGLIIERTPGAFKTVRMKKNDEEAVDCRPSIELDVSQILVALSWIAGDTSVADAVAKALTAGETAAQTAEQVERGERVKARGEVVAGAAATPLASSES